MTTRLLFLICSLSISISGCDSGDGSGVAEGMIDAQGAQGGSTDGRVPMSDGGGQELDATTAGDRGLNPDLGHSDADLTMDDARLPQADAGQPTADAMPPEAMDAGLPIDAAPPARPGIIEDTGDELTLLFVGNSYVNSNNLQNIVCELARQTGRWAEVVCQRVTAGGKRLSQHEADAANGAQLGQWLDPNNPDRPQWDAVILQEQSQIPGFPERNMELLASQQAVVALDARIAAIGAETALMMTWGRRDGDDRNPGLYPDYQTMQARLAAGYTRASEIASTRERTVHVLPVGLAWRQTWMRDADGDFRALYSGDGSHPAFLGSWLSAAVILNHLVDLDPDDAQPLNDRPSAEQLPGLRADVRAVSLGSD